MPHDPMALDLADAGCVAPRKDHARLRTLNFLIGRSAADRGEYC